jgi:hypothetical protein
VKLAPSAVHTRELLKGTVDRLKGDSSRESKEPLQLEGDKERSCERTSTRGLTERLHRTMEYATSCATKRCYELTVTINSFEFAASS